MQITTELDAKDRETVAELVKTGHYASVLDVLKEGIRLVKRREERLAELDQAIAEGLADSRAGRGKPMDEVFDRLEAKYQAMADTAKS
ncbi:type II toxin-antitoxin system ParD family antitoxin [Bosea caraganae]|uniref:Type II toxin-antitoxin system ParD family antitoxin n=1 Tax=Bosea caraganae TaxID=2763117 RepID=A0A370L4D0_9HYPH|nr:type II toxin-antitoxin system ParD family antitoxin [Bosea caraganae]RDJ22328.1 type II toxin-antitoxin system ParD family antitoxin [Bosea caraganae]RDJ23738.1 type II toxin-antitoxin system ParD family antitoxin [Bosea caraganae]